MIPARTSCGGLLIPPMAAKMMMALRNLLATGLRNSRTADRCLFTEDRTAASNLMGATMEMRSRARATDQPMARPSNSGPLRWRMQAEQSHLAVEIRHQKKHQFCQKTEAASGWVAVASRSRKQNRSLVKAKIFQTYSDARHQKRESFDAGSNRAHSVHPD